MANVLVTGSAGHLGSTLVECLGRRGHTVYASVRDIAMSQTAHLRREGVNIVRADITDARQIDKAVAGMDAVFHAAAIHKIATGRDAQAVHHSIASGTANVMAACKRHNVRKIILTSSAAAVGTAAAGENARDESNWNDTTKDPYLRAKTLAEKTAWEFAAAEGLNLIAILPAAIMGPGFRRHTPTTKFFADAVQGRIPMIAPLSFNIVDVRDVAEAHVRAYENDGASGRYIVANEFCTLAELFLKLKTVAPSVRIPPVHLPRALLGWLPPLDWIRSKIDSGPRNLTRGIVADYGYREPRFSSARVAKELGWRARHIDETLASTFDWLRRNPWLTPGWKANTRTHDGSAA